MNRICFSHDYPKLHGQTTAQLLAVKPLTVDRNTDADLLDDFGCDSGHDDEEERPYCNGGDCDRHRMGAEPCERCPFCDEEGDI